MYMYIKSSHVYFKYILFHLSIIPQQSWKKWSKKKKELIPVSLTYQKVLLFHDFTHAICCLEIPHSQSMKFYWSSQMQVKHSLWFRSFLDLATQFSLEDASYMYLTYPHSSVHIKGESWDNASKWTTSHSAYKYNSHSSKMEDLSLLSFGWSAPVCPS